MNFGAIVCVFPVLTLQPTGHYLAYTYLRRSNNCLDAIHVILEYFRYSLIGKL